MARIAVVGAGIVGLAAADALAAGGHEVLVLEKEDDVARHQTGRNSGVIHSGLYYAPGSLKATMCRAGRDSMYAFARENGIRVERCGKLVVATDASQLPRLEALTERAAANGVTARRISAEETLEYEPHVRAVAALRVEDTGIVDYTAVSRALASRIADRGGEVRLGAEFRAAETAGSVVRVETRGEVLEVDALVNCAGLHSDRVAAASGVRPGARIVPFRGEYFELVPERRSLVRGLIYPVPDPRFPFLGVHLTRMVDGSIHAGPNAVVALAREGYDWRTVSARDVASWAAYPGMWRLGLRFGGIAAQEVRRSLSIERFAASLAELVPELTAADLEPSAAGVRAQAMLPNGALVDDFLIRVAPRQVHVLNAPSPAATCSLEIGRHIAVRLDQVLAA